MMVSPEIQSRIDKVWDRLQEVIARKYWAITSSMSQIELDLATVEFLENRFIGYVEAEGKANETRHDIH